MRDNWTVDLARKVVEHVGRFEVVLQRLARSELPKG